MNDKHTLSTHLNIQTLGTFLPLQHKPLLIAGPCSAETEKQLLTTAHLIAQINKVSVLRAGIWKPRTRPGTFEGSNNIGLTWLKKARELTGLLTAVEVANANHVAAALQAGVDILWIGARSTGNPFTVQDIADALQGVDVPVMIKNPVIPDLALWIGALERINRAGITKLIAIHRGFFSSKRKFFRNDPMWHIPLMLQKLVPDLAIIVDPSHIGGQANLLPYIAQKALNLGMQGLMLESHADPLTALTDSEQQITPAALADLINQLVVDPVSFPVASSERVRV